MTIQEKIDVILKHVNTHIRGWFITVDEKLDIIIKRLDALENAKSSDGCTCDDYQFDTHEGK